jgi:hypothetical protein
MLLPLALTRRCLCHSFGALAASPTVANGKNITAVAEGRLTTLSATVPVSYDCSHGFHMDSRQSFGGAVVCLFTCLFFFPICISDALLSPRAFLYLHTSCAAVCFAPVQYVLKGRAKHRRDLQPVPIVLTTRRGASIYGALVSTVTSTRHAKKMLKTTNGLEMDSRAGHQRFSVISRNWPKSRVGGGCLVHIAPLRNEDYESEQRGTSATLITMLGRIRITGRSESNVL